MYIPYDQMSQGWELGGGTFADVYQGTWNTPTEAVNIAMKILKMTDIPQEYTETQARERMEKRFNRELDIWARLEHTNILKFYGHSTTPGPRKSYIFVSPLCPNGNLFDYMSQNPDLSARRRLDLALHVARGLEYLHTYPAGPIFHGDVKPNNIVLGDDFTAQLCDFGLARIPSIRPTGYTTSGGVAGSPYFEPYEMWLSGSGSFAGDIFSFAGVLLLLMTNQVPFYGVAAELIGRDLLEFEIMPNPAHHPMLPAADPLWGLMRQCWAKAPTQRPSIEVCIQELSNRYSG